MGQEPDRIRAEIEQTREEMSETVDALSYKADVKTRAKENLTEKKDSVKESIVGVKDKIVGAGDSATSTVSEKTPDAQEVKYQAKRAASVAQQNPLGLALGSVAESLTCWACSWPLSFTVSWALWTASCATCLPCSTAS